MKNASLGFLEREYNDSDDPMPASFVGRGNYDGVSFSSDGYTWYRLESFTGANSPNV